MNYYSGKSNTRFEVLLFVTYSIIQDIISSEMQIRTGPILHQRTTSFSVKDGQFDADFPSRSGVDVADGLCGVLTGPCLIACETPLTKTPERRKLSFDWRAVDR